MITRGSTTGRQMVSITQALELAMAHHNDGELSDAEVIYSQILQVEPNHADALRLLGVIAHQFGKNDIAVDFISKALVIVPDHADAHYNLGLALFGLNKTEKAIASYRRALAINPDYAEVHNSLGLALKEGGQLEEAVIVYQKVLALKPDYALAHNNLGLVHQGLGRLDAAIASFRRTVELVPDYALAHSNLGNALHSLGRLREAESSCRRALAIQPSLALAHNNLGAVLSDLGQWEAAIICFQKSLAIDRNFPMAHNNLGFALYQQKKFDASIACYQEALSIQPHFVQAHNNLGILQRRLGDLDKASVSLHRALDIDPNFSMAHNNLGLVLHDQGQWDEAVESYNRALAINPEYAQAYNHLGSTYREQGRLNAALACHQKAFDLKPSLFGALNNMGNVLRDQNKLDDALISYQKALTIEPEYDEGRHSLGLLQLLRGDFTNGWENYNYRWRHEDQARLYQNYQDKLWLGQELAGKRLLVWDEQGVGDSILYAGMIDDLLARGAIVSLACDRRLVPLYKRSFPTIDCLVMIGKAPDKVMFDAADFHVPFGNLGRWLRPSRQSFPTRGSYLVAEPNARLKLRNRYLAHGNNRIIGVAWHSESIIYGKYKTMVLADLRPILEIPGITFVDLQYGDRSAERASFAAKTGISMVYDEDVDQLADLDLYAAQVAAMDAIVTISNSTAHMAGALGVPTLLMLNQVPIWYWFLERADSPWYQSLRLFRQQRQDEWQDVVWQVKKYL